MKAHLTSTVSLLAVLSAALVSTLSAAPEGTTSLAYPVKSVNQQNAPIITPGTWIRDVVDSIGVPSTRITDDVWVYRNFRPDLPKALEDGCTILIISFRGGVVDDMKLVNQSAEKRLAMGAKVVPSNRALVAADNKTK